MNTIPSSLRILSIVPYKVFPAIMGGQKGIALFYKYLASLVPFICLSVQSNQANESYTVLSEIADVKTKYINPFVFVKLLKTAKKNNCTHLLFEHPYYAWMILLIKLLSSYKIIVHSHNIESERFRSIGKWWWKILWYYEGLAYRQAHYVWFKTTEDKQYAVLHYKVAERCCSTIPYGIENTALPKEEEIKQARQWLEEKYAITSHDTILLFNGTLSYRPNLEALKSILERINPLLLEGSLQYKILICGKNLPTEMNELKEYRNRNIIYCGFVDDIDIYFKGCDIFLNPVTDGGGIKTKLVEALGFGKKCISSINGAIGVSASICGTRLKIVAEKDWDDYYASIIAMSSKELSNDNSQFYDEFAWQHIAEKALKTLL